MKVLLATFSALMLSGCWAGQFYPATMQWNSTTVPFPDQYQREAARAVAARNGDLSAALVSKPKPMAGTSAFSPQRWYSCISGVIPRSNGRERLPRLAELFDAERDPQAYHIMLTFDKFGRPSVKDVLDSPLCRGLQFEPVTAEVPLI